MIEIRSDFKVGSYQGCFGVYRRASDAPKAQLQSKGVESLPQDALAYPQYRRSVSPPMAVTDWLLGAAALGSYQSQDPVLKLWWEYLG